MSYAAAAPGMDEPSVRRLGVAAAVGNFMEWFDFAVYGFFATTIGDVFFPDQSSTSSLLSSLAVFGVAFAVRPLGGIVVGGIGDRLGRRYAMALTVVMMGISTSLIAALPSYDAVGVLAPILLVLLRCAQGLSAGGEWAGSASFLIEFAPSDRRGLWGSILTATAAIGSLAGCLLAIALNAWLTPEQLVSWGWRIPFLLAIPVAGIGLYMRMRLEDTPVFREMQAERQMSTTPLRDAATENWRQMVLIFVCAAVHGVCFYYVATYVVNFLTSDVVGIERAPALAATAGGLAIYSLLCPLAGRFSDRVGRRPTMVWGSAGLAICAIPVFLLMSGGGTVQVIAGIGILGVFEAAVNVTTLVLLVEMFPARTRMSGGSTGYNVALAAVAGPAPLIAAALATGIDVKGSAAFYMVAVSIVGFVVIARWLPETVGRDLSYRTDAPATSIAGDDERAGAPAGRPASAN